MDEQRETTVNGILPENMAAPGNGEQMVMRNAAQKHKDMLMDVAPVLEEYHRGKPEGITSHIYRCVNAGKGDRFLAVYMDAVRKYLEDKSNSAERILLISDEEGIVRKVAAYLAAQPLTAGEQDDYYEEEDEDYEEYFVFEEEDDEDDMTGNMSWLQEVTFSSDVRSERQDLNPYHMCLAEVLQYGNVLILGLDSPGMREKKLEAVSCCPARRTMVAVPTAQADQPWVRQMVREQGFSMLYLPRDMSDHFLRVGEAYDEYLKQTGKEGISKDNTEKLIKKARRDLGRRMTEEDILWYLENWQYFLKKEEGVPAISQMEAMTGLAGAKKAAKEMEALEREKKHNPALKDVRKHMVFYGNPGTGKTTVARMMAKILAETDNTGEIFVTADRSELIGKYVGHTAPKVAQVFEEARGGVLFVDEAGFFLNENAGGYVTEAIREFVRYMEEYEDVTVIFALYAHEVMDFLALDAGLSSRIGQCVEFEDYTDKELFRIAGKMLADRGYQLSVRSRETISEYVSRLKKKAGIRYGNAREIRKLTESAIICHALNRMGREQEKGQKDQVISVRDIRDGISRLEQELQKSKGKFGFNHKGGNDHGNKSVCV